VLCKPSVEYGGIRRASDGDNYPNFGLMRLLV
jgi:hypothetical protein